jgi:hypothetical protein
MQYFNYEVRFFSGVQWLEREAPVPNPRICGALPTLPLYPFTARGLNTGQTLSVTSSAQVCVMRSRHRSPTTKLKLKMRPWKVALQPTHCSRSVTVPWVMSTARDRGLQLDTKETVTVVGPQPVTLTSGSQCSRSGFDNLLITVDRNSYSYLCWNKQKNVSILARKWNCISLT